MEFNDSFAKAHVDKWTKAWNEHNLKQIISLYSDNIEFHSPKIKVVYPNRNSATITNKKDLEEYFSLGLSKFSGLQFTPVDYFIKDDKVIFEYYGAPDNKIQWSVIEKFEFNGNGLITKSSVYYGAEDSVMEY